MSTAIKKVEKPVEKVEFVDILNIKILNIPRVRLLTEIKQGIVFTTNVDHLINLQKNREFYDAYQEADWVVCDSRIIYFFCKSMGKRIVETIPGAELFPSFCQYHAQNEDVKIFLLGGQNHAAEKAQSRINGKIKRNIVVDSISPSMGFEKNAAENEAILHRINQSEANVLAIGVGAPKQEIWIRENRSKLPGINLFMAVGATIEYEAGVKKRAPGFISKIGLEWLYRLITEPRRLWRRYLVYDLSIFYLFFMQIIGKYKNPFDKED